jgi:hypothetical protein
VVSCGSPADRQGRPERSGSDTLHSVYSILLPPTANNPQPAYLGWQVRWRAAEHQVCVAGVALRVILARSALTGTASPGAVAGESVEQVIEADLWAIPGGEPGKAVSAAPSTEVAADPHHDPRKFAKALDHGPAFHVQNRTGTSVAGFHLSAGSNEGCRA